MNRLWSFLKPNLITITLSKTSLEVMIAANKKVVRKALDPYTLSEQALLTPKRLSRILAELCQEENLVAPIAILYCPIFQDAAHTRKPLLLIQLMLCLGLANVRIRSCFMDKTEAEDSTDWAQLLTPAKSQSVAPWVIGIGAMLMSSGGLFYLLSAHQSSKNHALEVALAQKGESQEVLKKNISERQRMQLANRKWRESCRYAEFIRMLGTIVPQEIVLTAAELDKEKVSLHGTTSCLESLSRFKQSLMHNNKVTACSLEHLEHTDVLTESARFSLIVQTATICPTS